MSQVVGIVVVAAGVGICTWRGSLTGELMNALWALAILCWSFKAKSSWNWLDCTALSMENIQMF